MDDPIFVAFLVGVDRNSATIGTFTHYKRSEANKCECRVPSILPADKFNMRMEAIDRAAKHIVAWPDFYGWLGRDVGTWASFTKQSALSLVPHWFSETVEFICKGMGPGGNGPFVDLKSADISAKEMDRFRDFTGAVDSDDGQVYAIQIWSNLVVATLPIFANIES